MSDKAKLVRDRIIFLAVLVGGLLAAYHYYYKPLLLAKENAEAQNRQNTVAFADQLSKKVDSIQTMASQVSRLNDDLSRSEIRAGRWKALATNLQLKIDSLNVSGSAVASSGEDSEGVFYKVDFTGHRGILNYSGYTKYYTQSNSFHHLNAWFDDIFVHSELFQDVDEIWKIQTVSLTPGVKLRATSIIDSSIYIGLRATVQNQPEQTIDVLPPFGIEASLGVLYDGKERQLLPDVHVLGYYRYYYVGYRPLTQFYDAGLRYRFDVGKFITSIF